MSFRQWLHSEPVRRRIRSRFDGGDAAFKQWLANTEDYVEDDDALLAQILISDPASVARALARMASWSSLIPGVGAFLIPQRPDANGRQKVIAYQGYRGKAALLTDPPSRGMRQLAVRVRWGELYEKELAGPFSSDERLPYAKIVDPRARGPLIGAFAEALLPSGRGYLNAVLHRSEIDAVREEFSTDYALGPLENLPWYGPRCAVHELTKLFPLTAIAQRMFNDRPSAQEELSADEEIPAIGAARRVVVAVPDVDAWSAMQDAQTGAAA